jgi:hypothetical protein
MQSLRKFLPLVVVATVAAGVLGAGAADAGLRHAGSKKDSSLAGRSTNAVTSFALKVADGARRKVFALPGVARISVDCQAAAGAYSIHVDKEQAIGWVSYWEVETEGTVGGGQNLEPDQEGNLGPLAGFGQVTVTLRGGFGPTAHVATVLINASQPDAGECWISGHAFRG